ncbi:hypothetical protein N431DRAFT_339656 [Stipitochalara longipes BDJ]|nr:hypothetical protein N431DRAFT_339656 [Stipitochalara longipes BDJ]
MTHFMAQNEDGIEVVPGNRRDPSFDNEENDDVIPDARGWAENRSRSPSSIRTVMKHKTYQRNFLFWVAYIRKEPQNIGEIERQTCPLEDCKEAPFDTRDAMLQHVYTCPHLAKGTYKCWNCGRSERISKIHMNGCDEFRRFSTVRNSLRRAKRLLSSHPKSRSECVMNRQIISEKIVVLPTQAESYYTRHSETYPASTELDAFWNPEIHELEMATSTAFDKGRPCDGDQSQILRSELSASHDFAPVSEYRLESDDTSAELSTSYNSTWQAAENRCQPNARQSQPFNDGVSNRTLDNQQNWPQDQFGVVNHYGTLLDGTEFSETRSPVSPISRRDNSTCFSLSSSASRTNTDVSKLSFGSFYSSRDTSMSSLSSFNPQPEDHEKPPFRFFTEAGVNMMFSEPESMGESTEPVELPSSVDTYSFSWLGEVSNSVFSEPESTGEPAELVAVDLRTSPNASSLPRLEEETNWMFPMTELMGDSVQPVELPTPSNTHSLHRSVAIRTPKECPIVASQSRDIGARIRPKSSSSPSTRLSNISSPASVPIHSSSKYKCSCGFESHGKEVYKSSNFKRHQRTRTCRRFSPYQRPETTKSWQCPYPKCPKRFTRSDNLRVHQKQKGHFIELELRTGPFPLQPDAEAYAVREMLERHRYQGIESRDGGSIWQ